MQRKFTALSLNLSLSLSQSIKRLTPYPAQPYGSRGVTCEMQMWSTALQIESGILIQFFSTEASEPNRTEPTVRQEASRHLLLDIHNSGVQWARENKDWS